MTKCLCVNRPSCQEANISISGVGAIKFDVAKLKIHVRIVPICILKTTNCLVILPSMISLSMLLQTIPFCLYPWCRCFKVILENFTPIGQESDLGWILTGLAGEHETMNNLWYNLYKLEPPRASLLYKFLGDCTSSKDKYSFRGRRILRESS